MFAESQLVVLTIELPTPVPAVKDAVSHYIIYLPLCGPSY